MDEVQIADFTARIRLWRIAGRRRYRAAAGLNPVPIPDRAPEPHISPEWGHGEGASPAVAIRRAVDDGLAEINRRRRERGLKVLG